MLKVRVRNNSIHIGKHFSVNFQRTLRIPDDGKKEMDKEKGFAPQQDDSSVEIPENQVKKIKLDPESVIDGKW